MALTIENGLDLARDLATLRAWGRRAYRYRKMMRANGMSREEIERTLQSVRCFFTEIADEVRAAKAKGICPV
ncbi:MAG: hypothetical protein AAB910_01395 [Patescibacteria group bacterium]